MSRQRVRINLHLSEPIDVTSGVIQGSSVGPGLFSIYIDSMLMSIVCPSFAFADDLKFTELAVSALLSSIQSALDQVAVWSVAFHMLLSLKMCAVLYCGSNNPHRDYYCDGQLFSSISQFRDLGVLRSSDEIYAAHPGTVVTKANKVAGAILRAFRTCDPSILWQAFKSCVLPVLIYASPCWNPGLQRDSKALELVQRSFTKRLFDMHNISYSDRLAALASTTLSAVRMKVDMIFVFKILHGLIYVDSVAVGLKLRQVGTRGSGILLEHQRACNRRVNSLFVYHVPLIWETVPISILKAKFLAVFKKLLQQHLLDQSLA